MALDRAILSKKVKNFTLNFEIVNKYLFDTENIIK